MWKIKYILNGEIYSEEGFLKEVRKNITQRRDIYKELLKDIDKTSSELSQKEIECLSGSTVNAYLLMIKLLNKVTLKEINRSLKKDNKHFLKLQKTDSAKIIYKDELKLLKKAGKKGGFDFVFESLKIN